MGRAGGLDSCQRGGGRGHGADVSSQRCVAGSRLGRHPPVILESQAGLSQLRPALLFP